MEGEAALSVRLLGRAFYADLPAHLKLTLLALCDEASEDGAGICIGQKRLAVKVGATDRTVRSNLAALEDRGWLRKLDGKDAKYHTDRWEVVVEMLPHGPETSSGRRAETSSGGQPDRAEVQRAGERKSDVETTGSGLPPTQELPVKATQDLELFDTFYDEAYPRKVGRPKAATAFRAAVRKGADPWEIIRAACRFRDDPNREDAYTPHPTTWLHREGWNDGALPSRIGDRGNGSGGARTLAVAKALREQGQ